MLRRYVVRTLVMLIGLASTCAAPAVRAADLAQSLDRAAAASEATVLLVPSMAIYVDRIDETRIERIGCRYATSDPAAIRALVGLFKTADVRVDSVYQVLDLREGVYLTLSDGSLLKFFLQDNHGGRLPVRGHADMSSSGEVQTVPVIASRTLADGLREWAVRLGTGGTSGGGACDRMSAAPASAAPMQTGPVQIP